MSKQELKDTLAVRRPIEYQPANLKDQVVSINRVTKVVKGGKNLSFSALVVVGDQGGHAGFGMGKAREVPMAIRKAIEQAKKNMVKLNLKGTTIPHQVLGNYGSGQVLLKPAPEGTGVIAGGAGASRDGSRGNSERADEVARHVEPAQRDQSDVRRVAAPEGRGQGGGIPRQGSGGSDGVLSAFAAKDHGDAKRNQEL